MIALVFLTGVLVVGYGISLWSVPASVVFGGGAIVFYATVHAFCLGIKKVSEEMAKAEEKSNGEG